MATETPLRRPGPLADRGPGASEALAALLVWILVDRSVGPAYSRLAYPNPHLGDALFYARVGLLRLAETALFLLYWRIRGWRLKDLGLLGPRARAGWRVGASWALTCAALVIVLEGIFRVGLGMSFLGAVTRMHFRGRELVSLVVAGGIFGPIFEELLFRGILYGGLRKRLGAVPATVVVAVIFAAAHGAFRRIYAVQTAGGILFCAAYEVSGSLWAPLLIHISGNLAIFLAPLLL